MAIENRFVQNDNKNAVCYYRYSSSAQRDVSIEQQKEEAGGADTCGEKVTAQETAPEAPEAAPAPAEEPEKEITFSKKVITERDIIEANRDGVKVIRITERNILTALAKDAASARNIRLVRE